MAVVSVKPIPKRSINYGEGYTRRYKRMWRVIVDDDNDNEQTIGPALGLNIGDPYVSWDGSADDPLATCNSIECGQEEEASRVWIVTADYECPARSPQKSQSQPQGGSESNDPTQWLPKVNRTVGRLQITPRYHYGDSFTDQIAIVNSAGYPFNSVPPKNVRFQIYTHTCWRTSAMDDEREQYIGKVNSAAWNFREGGRWLLDDWETDDMYIGGTLYYMHRTVWHLCPEEINFEGTPTWQMVLLDAGTREVSGNPIKDPQTHMEVTRDWPLDGDGHKLTVAEIASESFVYLKFNTLLEADFDTVFPDMILIP